MSGHCPDCGNTACVCALISSDKNKITNKTIAVWFSCGVASAVAVKKTIELYGKDNNILILNNPIKEEDEDNLRFLKDVERWLDVKIEFVRSKEYPSQSCADVWEKRKYMSGIGGAPCTMILKKRARQDWQKDNHVDYHVLGFTVDEKKRHEKFIKTEIDNVLSVLIDANLTKDDCFKIVQDAGIDLPRIYLLGYPNANCIGCVKSQSPSYWQIVKENHPEVFNQRAEQSRRIGCKLLKYKGKRVFLDELPNDFKRVKLRKTNFECGIFCEEN
jgi:hypothetical protein